MEGINDLVDYRVEELGNALRANSRTKAGFKEVAGAINEALTFIGEQSKSTTRRFLRELCYVLQLHI